MIVETYKERFARILAETGALFFKKGLRLKDGRPTPYFVNMGMFKTGRLSLEMGSFFASMLLERGILKDVDIILGPSYKGSAIAQATAIALWKDYGLDMPFDYDRKEPKAHGEASSSASLFVNATFFEGCRIFVVDDVATSMATKYELLEKISSEASRLGIGLRVSGVGIAVDREQTSAAYDGKGRLLEGVKGKDAVSEFVAKTGVPVYAVAGIRELVDYLYREGIPVNVEGERRPIEKGLKTVFDEYLSLYGAR
jgi:orotate phosphoribosyltransferase